MGSPLTRRDAIELVLAAVQRDPECLEVVDELWRADHDVLLECVSHDGLMLQLASEKLRDDRTIVSRAVQQDADALQYASEALRKASSIVLQAARGKPGSFEFAAEELKDDKGRSVSSSMFFFALSVLQAVRHAGEALQWAAPVLRGSQRVAVDALAQNVEAWHHVAPPACDDQEVLMEALKMDGHLLQEMPEPWRDQWKRGGRRRGEKRPLGGHSSEPPTTRGDLAGGVCAPRELRSTGRASGHQTGQRAVGDRFSSAAEALAALKNGGRPRLVAPTSAVARTGRRSVGLASLEPPRGSKITVKREAGELRILFPPPLLSLELGPVTLRSPPCNQDTFQPLLRGALELRISPSRWSVRKVNGKILDEGKTAKLHHSGRKEVFVHLFEWSWEDEHIQGTPWWTRYQPVTYNLTSRSGDEQAFAQMVQRCRGAGVKIYVDAVLNHCAASTGTSITGSSYGPRKTPIFEPKDFHHTGNDLTSNCGVSDFSDIHNVQYCDLQGLPDLCTDCEVVQDKMAAYLSHLVELGVAGVRLDAAKHIPRDDLAKIFAKDVVSEDLYLDVADVTEFNYYLQLDPMIADSGQMFALESFGQSGLLSGGKTVVFIDNHDTQRSQDVNAAKLTYKSGKLYLLATAFMLAHPYGYPQVMSSFHFTEYDQGRRPPSVPVHSESDVHCGEFQPWVCEHRWVGIANMVAWRKISAELPITHFTALGEDTISFCRGEVACVAFNRQESDDWDVELTFPLAPGAAPHERDEKVRALKNHTR
eukprot:g3299.t1